MSQLPGSDYLINPEAWQRLTERNITPLDSVAMNGLGTGTSRVRVPNTGLLANVRIVFKGSLVVNVGTGTVTSGYGWPWNVLKECAMSVNGQTQIKRGEGLDYRMRRNRVHRNPREAVSSAINTDTVGTVAQAGAVGDPRPGTIASGTYPITLEYEIPMVHDDVNLIGLLYAQSSENYLQFSLSAAAIGDLFALTGTATAALTGTWHCSTEYYQVPLADDQSGRAVLPDMSWLHGVISSDMPFNNTGWVRAPLIRADGSLLLYAGYLDNGGLTQIAASALEEVKLTYGGNNSPRKYSPIEQLLAKNGGDYNGRLHPEWIIIDNEVDNPVRDAVFPKGVTELQLEVKIPAGTTINSNARLHFVEETLFSGAQG